uniref:Uncharacterized protein n=1 Tax=Leersia perrieri TaxID=77586 RepID=A0A0D9XIG4_9ORYZ
MGELIIIFQKFYAEDGFQES